MPLGNNDDMTFIQLCRFRTNNCVTYANVKSLRNTHLIRFITVVLRVTEIWSHHLDVIPRIHARGEPL